MKKKSIILKSFETSKMFYQLIKSMRKIDRVKDAQVEFGAAEADAQTARESVEEINAKMVEIGKGRIEGNKKLIDKAKKEIKEMKKKILKVQNDAKTAGRNRDKAAEALQNIKVSAFLCSGHAASKHGRVCLVPKPIGYSRLKNGP